MMTRTGIFRFVFAALSLVLFVIGCAVNPVTGANEMTLLGESWEVSTGEKNYLPAQQLQGGRYTADPALTDYVAAVGKRLTTHAERPLPYEFVVINSDVPNAWALPGGKIGVHRGLLVRLDSEAELAALLGHEIVHAAARHGSKSAERGLLLKGALDAAAMSMDGTYANLALAGAQAGAVLINQRYSREAEREADYHGMYYMAKAGYNPQAAVSLQEKLVALNQGKESSWLQGLFASHPPSPERVRNNQATLGRIGTGGEAGRKRYQTAIAYAKSKQPAYQLAGEAAKLIKRGTLEQALVKLDAAIAIEPREARFYGMKGDVLRQAGLYETALVQYNQAIARDQGYYQYYLGRGLSYRRLRKRQEARHDLNRSNSLLPTQAATEALNTLGR